MIKSRHKEDIPIAAQIQPQQRWRPVLLNIIMGGILLFSIGFRIYKAHNTGILFDEVWTCEEFATNLHTALRNYSNTNNHIINSMLIVLTQKVFGGYEHYPRIPAILFGILFCCAVVVILYQTVSPGILRAFGLLLILMNWFVSDLTYLGRGYAIALGVTFGGIALLLYLYSEKGRPALRRWWVAAMLIVMNFMALGSMLSSLSIVVSINLVYAAGLMINSCRRGTKEAIRSLIHLGVIAGGSAILLLWMYYPVISQIQSQSKGFKTEPFMAYLGKVLWGPLIFLDYSRIRFNMLMCNVSVMAAVLCVLVWIIRYARRRMSKMPGLSLFSASAGCIVLLFVTTLALMWVQSGIWGVSLGEPRNGVFLTVLMMLAAIAVMGQAVETFSRVKVLSNGLCVICGVLMAIMTFLNWPSYNAVHVHPRGWAIESAMGPLARQLKQIDPNQTWRIKLIKVSTDYCYRPIRYYKKFGYHIEVAEGDSYDILVVMNTNMNDRYVCLNSERFTEHQCCMIVNPQSFQGKRVFYQMKVLPSQKR